MSLLKVLVVGTTIGCAGGLPCLIDLGSEGRQTLLKGEVDGMYPESGNLDGITVCYTKGSEADEENNRDEWNIKFWFGRDGSDCKNHNTGKGYWSVKLGKNRDGGDIFVKSSDDPSPIESPIKGCFDQEKNDGRVSGTLQVLDAIKKCLNGENFDNNRKDSWVKKHLEGKEWIWKAGKQRR